MCLKHQIHRMAGDDGQEEGGIKPWSSSSERRAGKRAAKCELREVAMYASKITCHASMKDCREGKV